MICNMLSKAVYILLTVLTCLSCTTMKPMEEGLSRQQVFEKINPGDKVSIYTTNSEKHLIVVDKITGEQIEGSGKVFKFDDIVEIRQQKFSPLKTGGVVLGATTILMVALIMLLVIAAGG